MDWGPQTSTQIGRARSNEPEVVISWELNKLVDGPAGSAESIKNFSDVSTLLHGNNSQLVFFINPDQESFIEIMENSSTLRPILVKITSS